MAEFPAALDAALSRYYGAGTGRAARGAALRSVAEVKSPITSARGLQARMRQMEKAYGGKAKAAAAAGMHRDTWRKMGRGGKVRDEQRRKLEKAHKALSDTKQRKRSTGGKRPPKKMAVTARVVIDPRRARYVNSTPRRTFNADVPALNLTQLAREWARGLSPDFLAETAREAIADAYQFDGIAFEGDAEVELEE